MAPQLSGNLPLVEIELIPDRRRLKSGERIELAWKTSKAEKVYLLEKPGSPSEVASMVIEWNALEQMGKAIDMQGKIALTPKLTTTYVIAAVARNGRFAKSVTFRIEDEKLNEDKEGRTWYNPNDIPVPRPEDFILLPERDRDLYRAILCAFRGPQVTYTIDRCCYFTDEPAHLEWNIVCANCADQELSFRGARLRANLSLRSGTELNYTFEGGGSTRVDTFVRCLLPMRGESDLDLAVWWGSEPGMEWTSTILAEDYRGRSDSKSVSTWFLPRARFEGCTPNRKAEIEEALLELCCLLRRGCIAATASLDRSVAAFRDGRLVRLSVAEELSRQMWNLDLITFKSVDVSDADWRGSKWQEYTNSIELQWSPGHRPNLPYVILHELLHKVGFNGDLSAFYTDAEIENQVNQTARACFPQLPPMATPEE